MLVQSWPMAVAVALACLDTFYESVRGSSAGGLSRVCSACGIFDCEEKVVVGGQGGKACLWTPVSIKLL